MTLVRKLTQCLPVDFPIEGRKRNTVFGLVDPIYRRLQDHDTIKTEFGDIRLNYAHEPERLLSYAFYNLLRHYEKSDLGQFIMATVKPGSAFIDVGANLGFYSFLARRQGADAVAVEPEPSHGAYLERNEAVYGKVLRVAFSDGPGALPLYYLPSNTGATTLVQNPGWVKGTDVVPVTSFSEAARAGKLGDPARISLIKIDVEGHELHAVRGLQDFLAQGHRPQMWCEVRGDRTDHSPGTFRGVSEMLAAFGYAPREMKHGRFIVTGARDWAERAVFDLLFSPA
jgi:FkbM family methyltransferase